MGIFEVHIVQLFNAGPLLRKACKKESEVRLRLRVMQDKEKLVEVCTAPFMLCTPAKGAPPSSNPSVAVKPSFPAAPFALSPVRFTSHVLVELINAQAEVLGFASLAMEHGVLGVERRIKLSLYPSSKWVDEDTPKSNPVCEVLLAATPKDFGEDPAKVDHVTRTEEEATKFERLRLFHVAYNPDRLPWLDLDAAEARKSGWDATFRKLLSDHHREPSVSRVRVTIKSGADMPREGSSYVDPYVRVSSTCPGTNGFGEVFQTATVCDVKDPVFNETFELRLLQGSNETLVFRLWDYDPLSSDDVIGEARLPLGLLCTGVPTERRLPVFASEHGSWPNAWLIVEVCALDFGLEPAAYGSLVEAVVREDLPRLTKYYTRYCAQKLRAVESDLVAHSLTPGGIEKLFSRLVLEHGLEPGKDVVTVTVRSVQDIATPNKRQKVDFTKLPGDVVKIAVNSAAAIRVDTTRVAPSRSRLSIPNGSVQVPIARPEKDMIRVNVMIPLRAEDGKAKDNEFLSVGWVEVSLLRLARGVEKRRTYPLVVEPHSSCSWMNGSVTVSIHSDFIGTSGLEIDEEVESVQAKRLSALLSRYRKSELASADRLMSTLPNPQSYIDELIRVHGPEPGAYQIQLTVVGCRELPKLEMTGCDPYVRIESREEVFTTNTMKANLNPTFNETFTLEVVDPVRDEIKFFVMDYDSNSADDAISEISIPVGSIFAEAATRWLPLCPSAERPHFHETLPLVEGSLGISVRAVGFGPASLPYPPEQEALYRGRAVSLLSRYAPRSEMLRYETLLWAELTLEASVGALIRKYGLEYGTGITKVTVHSVQGLVNKDGKPMLARPIVEVRCPASGPPRPSGKVTSTAAPIQPAAAHTIETTIEVDVERPLSDDVTLTISDAATKAIIGTAKLCLVKLHRGVSRKRTHAIILNEGTHEASIAGYITVGIISDMIGHPGSPVPDGAEEELEQMYAKRLRGLYNRYLPQAMGNVDRELASTADLARRIEQLIQQYGPEPGTYRAQVTVIGCKNLPRIEAIGGGDPYVVVSCERESFRTPHLASTVDPVFNQTFELDIVKPATAVMRFLVMDHDKSNDDDEWCEVYVPMSSFCSDATTRWLPLIAAEGAKKLAGTIGICVRCFGFGAPQLREAVEAEEAARSRCIRLLERYDKEQLPYYEKHLWEKGSFAASLEALVSRCGRETGTGLVRVTVHSITGLENEGKIYKTASPYVEVSANETALPNKVQRTKTQKPPGPQHQRVEETFTIDLSRPHQGDLILLRVVDDVVGSDLEIGQVSLSCQQLQRGVPKRRTHAIIHDAGSRGAKVVGYTCVSLHSDCFGSPSPLDEEVEPAVRKRIFNMARRYDPSLLNRLDGILNPTMYLDEMIRKHGPEPGTYRVELTVLGCKDLPAVELIGGCDPYVAIQCGNDILRTKTINSCLNPVFNETFVVDVIRPESDIITLTVMDYDRNSDDDEVCQTVIPLQSLCGEVLTRWLPLVPCTQEIPRRGTIGVAVRCIGFGPAQLPVPLEKEAEYRERFIKMYDRYDPKRLPPTYEKVLWTSGGSLSGGSFEAAIDTLVRRFGPEPGSGVVTVRVDAVEDLTKEGKLATQCSLYVEVLAPLATGGTSDVHTKTVKQGGKAGSYTFGESFKIELADPASSLIDLRVMDDVIGSDYTCGVARVSCALLQRGEAKQRWYPIFHAASAQVVGRVQVTLFSTAFGRKDGWSEAEELRYRDRLLALYLRHAREKISTIDVLMARHAANWEGMLRSEIGQCGPEPGTYLMSVAMYGTRNLVSAAGLLRFVVRGARCTGGQTFELDANDPMEDMVGISAFSANGGLFATAAVTTAIGNPTGAPVRRWLNLMRIDDGDKVTGVIAGQVEVVFSTTSCGNAGVADGESRVQLEEAFRTRLIRLFLRGAPLSVGSVDSLVFGRSEAEWESSLATSVECYGAEDGQTTIAVSIIAIDDLTVDAPTAYAKVSLNDQPVAKRLRAELLLGTAAAQGSFSKPVDCLKVQQDVIHVKIGNVGVVSRTALGRCMIPARSVPMCSMTPQQPVDGQQEYQLSVWCRDEASGKYVGRVTLLMRVKGFPHSRGGPSPVPGVAEAVLFKEMWPQQGLPDGMPQDGHTISSEYGASKDSLFVHLVACRGLPQMDTFGTCDTFAELVGPMYGGDVSVRSVGFKTQVVSGTLNPLFRFHRDDVFTLTATNADELSGCVSHALRGAQPPKWSKTQPGIELVVKDKDPRSEELIGSAFLSPELLFSGLWNVDPVELAVLTTSGAQQWFDAHKDQLLCVPLVLPPSGGTGDEAAVVRGEAYLATTAPLRRAASLTTRGCDQLRANETMLRCRDVLRRNRMWKELQRVQEFCFKGLFAPSLTNASIAWADRCRRFEEDLAKEYGR